MTANEVLVAKFHTALAAPARSSEIPDSDDAYGWLVGSWELDVRRYWAVDVSSQRIKGEVHASWVLEGRAVQDLWIMPRIGERSASFGQKAQHVRHDATAWDSSIKAWRITWSNPAGEHFEQQIGRRSGNQVVQIGTRPDGTPTRWRFTEITSESFHWLGESLAPDGVTWNLEGEFLASRTS